VSEVNRGERWISGNIVRYIVRTPLLEPALFNEFTADGGAMRYLGIVSCDGHECHVLENSWPPKDGREAVSLKYWIGVDDGLPRKHEIRSLYSGSASVTTATFSHLSVNVEVPVETFQFTAPQGLPVEVYLPQPRAEPLAIGAEAPNWTLSDPEGTEHSLVDYRGKLVVLDFWGTWCHPCLQAMPGMQSVHDQLAGEGVVVLGLSCNEPKWADPAKLVKDRGYTYQILLQGERVVEEYHVTGFPTFYVVGKDGRILQAGSGFFPGFERELVNTLRKHL
jgi:peroxiredoxin